MTTCFLFPLVAPGWLSSQDCGHWSHDPEDRIIAKRHRVIYTQMVQLHCTDGETEAQRGQVSAQDYKEVRSRA